MANQKHTKEFKLEACLCQTRSGELCPHGYNACSESFFGTLKQERCDKVFTSRHEAFRQIFEYMEVFYNRQKFHSILGYLNPEQFEQGNVA